MTDDRTREIAYLALGRLIAAECPAGFQTATLGLDIHDGQTRLWLGSTQPDGTEVRFDPSENGGRAILESLRAIRHAMAEEEGAPWRSCVVTLRAGGHFALDVEY